MLPLKISSLQKQPEPDTRRQQWANGHGANWARAHELLFVGIQWVYMNTYGVHI